MDDDTEKRLAELELGRASQDDAAWLLAFVRQLQADLAAANARVAELKADNERMSLQLANAAAFYVPDAVTKHSPPGDCPCPTTK